MTANVFNKEAHPFLVTVALKYTVSLEVGKCTITRKIRTYFG